MSAFKQRKPKNPNSPSTQGRVLVNRSEVYGRSAQELDEEFNISDSKTPATLRGSLEASFDKQGDRESGYLALCQATPSKPKHSIAEAIAKSAELNSYCDSYSPKQIEDSKAIPFIDPIVQSKIKPSTLTLEDISYAWSLGIDYAFYVNGNKHNQVSLYNTGVKRIKISLESLYHLEPGERPNAFPENEVYDFIKYHKPLELIFFYVAHYNKIVQAHQRRFKNFKAPDDPTPEMLGVLLNEVVAARERAAIGYLWRKGEPMGEYVSFLDDCPKEMPGLQKNALYLCRYVYDKVIKAFFKEKSSKAIELQKKVHENIENISKIIGDQESAASFAVSKTVELIEKRYGPEVSKAVGDTMFLLNRKFSESMGKVNTLARRNLYEASFRIAEAGDVIATANYKDLCRFIEENGSLFETENVVEYKTYKPQD